MIWTKRMVFTFGNGGRSRVARLALLSRLVTAFTITLWCSFAQAHEIQPAIADVDVSADKVSISIVANLESLVAGLNLSGLSDTNASPLAAEYDAARAFAPAALEQEFRKDWDDIAIRISVSVDGLNLPLTLEGVNIPEVGDIELARSSSFSFFATLPKGTSPVVIAWEASYGPLIVRQAGAGDEAYTGYLTEGASSEPLPRIGVAVESWSPVVARYIVLGFEHILPKGLDHILFVLGLFFFSLNVRPILTQVTAFTLAHTCTLALASLGYVSVPPQIVEPLIAASITYVAVENILWQKMSYWRTVVVFGFGLLHGLGFASVLGEIGLGSRFLTGLISFNIGVELGQLAVIASAYLLVGHWFGQRPWYRSRIAIPASVGIALMGEFWFVQRVFF
jgi:hypothetical protein